MKNEQRLEFNQMWEKRFGKATLLDWREEVWQFLLTALKEQEEDIKLDNEVKLMEALKLHRKMIEDELLNNKQNEK